MMISNALGIASERLPGSSDPRHVAVVVGPEHVDHQVVAPLELVLVVGDVGREIGQLAVGAGEHAVLVVAEGGRAQPHSALVRVDVPLLLEPPEHPGHGSALVVLALVAEALRPHPEAFQRGPDALEHGLDSQAGELGLVEARGAGYPVGDLGHVEPLVAVLGGLLTSGARLDRGAEALDLAAVVVHVVLALHVVPGEREDPAERIPVGGVAAGGHRDRPGGVGAHELHVDALGGRRVRDPVAVARGQQVGDRLAAPGVGHREVQEARARHVDLTQRFAQPFGQRRPELLRDLARRRAHRGREQHGGVGGVVAEAALLRSFENRHVKGTPAAQRSCGLGYGSGELRYGVGHRGQARDRARDGRRQ